MTTLTYGDVTVDTSTLPPASIDALLRRGLSHYLGNEQASKLTSWKESEEGKTASDAQVSTKKAELIAGAMRALHEGTVGTRTFGPRGTALETLEREVAWERLSPMLAKVPGYKASVFKDGGKLHITGRGDLTKAELIAAYIAKNAEAVRKEAESRVRARERMAKGAGELADAI